MITGTLQVARSSSMAGHGSHGPIWLFFVIGGIILIFAIATVINPKLQWQMSRWQFKNPEAREPSAKGLIAIRVISIFISLVAIAILIVGATKA